MNTSMSKFMVCAMLQLLSKPSVIAFGTPEEDAALKAEQDKKAAEEAAKKAPKTYTQKEVDDMSAAQRYGYKKELEKAATEALRLSEDKRLSQEERDAHAKRADELEAQYKTQKEMEEKRVKSLQDNHKKELDAAKGKAKEYEGKYANVLIDHELTKEAALAEEQISGQLSKFLRQDTVLQDEIGADGKPTGEQVVRVKFDDVDKDGKPIKLVLSVKDTLKRMRELPEQYGNFFKGSGSSGMGGSNGKGGGGNGKPPVDTASYIEARNAGKKKS